MFGVFMNDLQDNITMKLLLREYISGKSGHTTVRYDTVKLNETKLGGIPALSATYEVNSYSGESIGYFEGVNHRCNKRSSGYILDYQAGSEVFDVLLPQVNKILRIVRNYARLAYSKSYYSIA